MGGGKRTTALVPFPPPHPLPQQKPKPRARELARRLTFSILVRCKWPHFVNGILLTKTFGFSDINDLAYCSAVFKFANLHSFLDHLADASEQQCFVLEIL